MMEKPSRHADVGQVPLFCGGIGDVFLQCCTTDRYRVLSGADCPKLVVNASRNEYSDEIFRWHPNVGRFEVIRALPPPGSPGSKQELYRSLGLAETSIYEGRKGRKDVDWNTRFPSVPARS